MQRVESDLESLITVSGGNFAWSFDIQIQRACGCCLKKKTRKMAVWVLIHLYHAVDQFWNNVFDFISTKSVIDLICNNKHKQFGFQEKENYSYFINGLLLCARFLIYRCKYSKTRRGLNSFFQGGGGGGAENLIC